MHRPFQSQLSPFTRAAFKQERASPLPLAARTVLFKSRDNDEHHQLQPLFKMATMKAVGVASYGPVENFESRDVPRPSKPEGRDVLVQ